MTINSVPDQIQLRLQLHFFELQLKLFSCRVCKHAERRDNNLEIFSSSPDSRQLNVEHFAPTCDGDGENPRPWLHGGPRVDGARGEGEVLLPAPSVGLLPDCGEVDGERRGDETPELRQALSHHIELITTLLVISSVLGQLLLQ